MSEKMRDSDVDWIGEIPEGWEVKKFKYFFETTKGLSITKEKLTDKGIPVISYGQIHSKYGRKVDSTKDLLPFVPEDYLRYKQALLTKGNFIFADTSEDIEGSGNFSTRTDGEGRLFAGYHTIIARLLDTKNNDFRYFMYLFDSEWFRNQIRHSVSGVKVFSITQSILKNTTILFPISLAEQKAVADYLDKQTSKFDQAQKLLKDEIERLRAYKKSLIYETVTKGLDKNVQFKDSGVDWIGEIPEGWEVKRLKYVIEIKDGTHDTPEYVNEGIPLITSKNLNSEYNEIDFSTTKNISILDSEKINKRSNVEQGDILMPMIGTVGGAVQVKTDNIFSIKNVALFKTSNDFELSGYLFYYLNSELTNLQFKHVMSGGVQSFVSLAILSELKVVVPPREVLSKVVSHLDEKANKINQIIKIKEQQLANLSEQRKTLIYEVVTGKRGI